MPGPGGVWSGGGGLVAGGLVPGGCLVLGGSGRRGLPGGSWTVTAAGGTHLTGMHSCYCNRVPDSVAWVQPL